MKTNLSVQWKILAPMALIFILIIATITIYSAEQQKQRLLRMTEEQMQDLLSGYLDSMNTLMFTGAMGNREMLRQKVANRDGIEELRMLRGEAVSKTFGPGFDSERPKDELDRKALSGESVVLNEVIDGDRHLTVIQPFVAVSDHKGTNCLTCHQVKEGTVLGAARLRFSLADRDAAIHKELFINAGINFLVMIIGLVVIHMIMWKVVVKPLQHLQTTMISIGKHADLRPRVMLDSNDEFQEVGTATNEMLERFQPTVHNLAKTTKGLNQLAIELAQVTRQTRDGVGEQQKESVELARSISELLSAAEEVSRHACEAEEAASNAQANADYGNQRVNNVAQVISRLAHSVDQATGVVKQLAIDTHSIGQVSQSISDIADQTNLLALNAAIEAARAGEQGRGFAVVADEVRSLAVRTQESTKEIRSIIDQLASVSEQAVQMMDTSKKEADESVAESNQASIALQEIAQAVENIRQMNTMISTAATEQSSVVAGINQNIQAITTVSQQNALGSSRTLEESEEIARIAAQLGEIVDQFKA